MKTRLDNLQKAQDLIYEIERIRKEIKNVQDDANKYAELNDGLYKSLIKQKEMNIQLLAMTIDYYNEIIKSLTI